MCREWNEVDFEDPELKYVGTATINEVNAKINTIQLIFQVYYRIDYW